MRSTGWAGRANCEADVQRPAARGLRETEGRRRRRRTRPARLRSPRAAGACLRGIRPSRCVLPRCGPQSRRGTGNAARLAGPAISVRHGRIPRGGSLPPPRASASIECRRPESLSQTLQQSGVGADSAVTGSARSHARPRGSQRSARLRRRPPEGDFANLRRARQTQSRPAGWMGSIIRTARRTVRPCAAARPVRNRAATPTARSGTSCLAAGDELPVGRGPVAGRAGRRLHSRRLHSSNWLVS